MDTLKIIGGRFLPLLNIVCIAVLSMVLLFNLNSRIIAQTTGDKPRLDFGIKMDVCKKHSLKYFDNDTTIYTPAELDYFNSWKFSDNYFAINFNWKRYYNHNIILLYEFRYKIWGFKENFFIPNYYPSGKSSLIGTRVTLINLDGSLSIMKDILLLNTKWYIRPKIGLTIFTPFSLGLDSNIYQKFGRTEINTNYRGSPLKLGGNIGFQFCFKPNNTYCLSFSAEYWTPFNNSYTWSFAERVPDTHYPWRKYKKNNNALYFGVGIDRRLRRR